MTAASQPEVVTLRSGEAVLVRQVQPGDGSALVRAYANLGEQSRYRRFFTVMPELPEATVQAAVQVDHTDHEALVALPQLSAEIVGECRYVRLADQPGTADLGVTVVDAWQGRGLGSALLARLSERALEAGIEYFTAEVLAENRTALALLPALRVADLHPHQRSAASSGTRGHQCCRAAAASRPAAGTAPTARPPAGPVGSFVPRAWRRSSGSRSAAVCVQDSSYHPVTWRHWLLGWRFLSSVRVAARPCGPVLRK